MKRQLFFALLLTLATVARAQTGYNNEWIDHSKTYYKFKVPTDGLYRISQGMLASYGLAAFDVKDFQLWRNGQQVPIYTTASSGPLAGDGYIEFYGRMNDGKPDKALYRISTDQPYDKYNLFTDTASYFLTLAPGENNLRYTTTGNNVSANTLKAEKFCTYTTGVYYKTFNLGYSDNSLGSAIYSSSYDFGEGFFSGYKTASDSVQLNLTNLNVNTTGGTATLNISILGSGANNTRTYHISVNNAPVKDVAAAGNTVSQVSIPGINPQLLANTAAVHVKEDASATTDNFGVAYAELAYPRNLVFSAIKNPTFQLPASDTGNYLQITGFATGGVAPVLYDVTNGLRIVADISTANAVKIVLPPSLVPRTLVLMAADPASVNLVKDLQERQFVDYTNTSNQGDFLIIAHPSLRDGDGADYVEQYRQYRASAAGGSFDSKVYDVTDLTDQFAYGMTANPLAVKNFLRYARHTFNVKPRFAFLIGHGVNYADYRGIQASAGGKKMMLVPTFGYPASDLLLSAEGNDFSQPQFTPIGRLSAVSGQEVGYYLDKVKEYESTLQQTTGAIADQAWKKNVIHVVGADDYLADLIGTYLSKYESIIEDTLYGGSVATFKKSSASNTETLGSDYIASLFEAGVGLVTYFGHSSSTILAYNLDDPSKYNNKGKYPIFIIDGCEAADVFNPDTSRLRSNYAISEKYVFAQQRGGVACVGSSYLGITNYLDVFTQQVYSNIAKQYYGQPIGEQIKQVVLLLGSTGYALSDFLGRSTLEQIILQGDPSLSQYHFDKPDYAIEDPQVKIDPAFISVADVKFTVTAKIYNLGRATGDSVGVLITRKTPDGVTSTLFNKKVAAIHSADSLTLVVPVVGNKEKGNNTLTVTVDPDNKIDELQENNNAVTKEFYIYEQEIRPVAPADFSIQSKSPIKFYASTADALDSVRNYLIQVDTTELFNSPSRVDQVASGKGGIISWTPPITLHDSVVYYWRVAIIPQTGNYVWSGASFVYISGAQPGWNQSHYYQFLHDTYNQSYMGADRKFAFDTLVHNLYFHTMVYPTGGDFGNYVYKDGQDLQTGACGNILNSIAFFMYDEKTNTAIQNMPVAGGGLYGSGDNGCVVAKPYSFYFPYNDATYRKRAMDFIDSIPVGRLFAFWNWGSTTYNSNPQFIDTWKADATAPNGPSLYKKFKDIGFSSIDSFYHNVPFLYVGKKRADGTFQVIFQKAGATSTDLVEFTYNYAASLSSGSFTSGYIGPASQWGTVNWSGTKDSPYDSMGVSVYGVKSDLTEELLYTNSEVKKDTSISYINAVTYPMVHLVLNTSDTANLTPFQLKRWQVTYKEIPEGAVAPNTYFNFKDTLAVGEPLNFGMAFNNISDSKFDSIKVKLTITDQQNVTHDITLPRTRPLPGGDTLHVATLIDTKSYIGKNTLYVNVNPDNDQPEQFTYNNFIYKDFYVKDDTYKPTLDVTFDGVHILSRDIVSSKPQVLIRLEDDSKYLALNDTSLFNVQVRYPDGSMHAYKFGTDTLQFIPANLSTGQNNASVILRPFFPQDGDYELIATGKDVRNNAAGRVSYDITFRVYNKPMISNLLNYPNPFTTSTAFVFTITGAEVPQMLRIQILTITGKIVREINKQELGPLHIGRNITTFKWNGTDQFGNKVGNGVYLYRVVTNLNGKSLDKFTDSGDNTDQYFKGGYGKMYLMR